MRRIMQVIKYGWIHAGIISKDNDHRRLSIFYDIIRCFLKYKMWSNQYMDGKFYDLNKTQRRTKGLEYREKGIKRDLWQKDFFANRKFFIKYSQKRYELGHLREKRKHAYTKQYNTGSDLSVEYDVHISRQHYLDGTIKIGNNVLLAKHVFIDYSGDVIIGDNVQLTNGVIIETHRHIFHSDYKIPRNEIEQTVLEICDGAVVGSRAIILPSCHRIGKYARIGAGAVVTKDIPDYAVAIGVPARIVRTQ